jgi:hypothetical protein
MKNTLKYRPKIGGWKLMGTPSAEKQAKGRDRMQWHCWKFDTGAFHRRVLRGARFHVARARPTVSETQLGQSGTFTLGVPGCSPGAALPRPSCSRLVQSGPRPARGWCWLRARQYPTCGLTDTACGQGSRVDWHPADLILSGPTTSPACMARCPGSELDKCDSPGGGPQIRPGG